MPPPGVRKRQGLIAELAAERQKSEEAGKTCRMLSREVTRLQLENASLRGKVHHLQTALGTSALIAPRRCRCGGLILYIHVARGRTAYVCTHCTPVGEVRVGPLPAI